MSFFLERFANKSSNNSDSFCSVMIFKKCCICIQTRNFFHVFSWSFKVKNIEVFLNAAGVTDLANETRSDCKCQRNITWEVVFSYFLAISTFRDFILLVVSMNIVSSQKILSHTWRIWIVWAFSLPVWPNFVYFISSCSFHMNCILCLYYSHLLLFCTMDILDSSMQFMNTIVEWRPFRQGTEVQVARTT